MAETTEIQDFIKKFYADAQRRKARLEQSKAELAARQATASVTLDSTATTSATDNEVSYPPLSPLPEEGDETARSSPEETDLQEESTNTDYHRENESPDSSPDLNYSSDLSLECESTITTATNSNNNNNNDVYWAEPILCHTSPDQQQPVQQQVYRSPRKTAPPAEQAYYQQPVGQTVAPLQERQPEQKGSSLSLPISLTTEQIIRDLKRKVEIAEQGKIQLKKAVEVSKHGSKEHIEAARLLQIVDLEHLSYTNHVAMLEKGIRKKNESLGSLKLSGIRLRVSSKLRDELAHDGVSHYFFCVACCGTDVKATEVVNTDDIRKQDLKAYIQFKRDLTFTDLPPEFVVKLEVFELITGHVSPKLLQILTPSKKARISSDTHFKRVGNVRLTLADREANYKNLTHWSKHEESLYLEREFKFHMELRPEQLPTKSGMLHVRCLDQSGRPDWSRFWVDLSGGQIKFWKTVQDASDCRRTSLLIEIRDLCSESVQKLTPDDDLYRQNSFVLYTLHQKAGGEGDTLFQRILKDDPSLKIVKHQFAAENKEDRDSWCFLLEKSMLCFREWNGKAKVLSLDKIKDTFSALK